MNKRISTDSCTTQVYEKSIFVKATNYFAAFTCHHISVNNLVLVSHDLYNSLHIVVEYLINI